MNTELVVLRALHVLPGVIWVGGASLMAWVIEPALRQAGPTVQGPAMRAFGKRLTSALLTAAGVTIVMGLALVARTPGHAFGDLFTTGWGWAIGLGLVAAIIASGFGSMSARALRQMDAVGAQINVTPTADQAAAMAALQGLLRRNARVASILGMVAVVLMVSARYV